MNRFVFLDTETTGLPQRGVSPRIVSLTWAVYSPDGLFERMVNSIVRPEGFQIPTESTKIHRITHDYAVRMGRPLRDVLGELAEVLSTKRDCTIVGHNLDFDRRVVQSEFGRSDIICDLSSFPQICTMQTTVSVCRLPREGGGYKWPTLQELHTSLFGCIFEDAHSSKNDVEATIRCFFELRRRGFFKSVAVDLPEPSAPNAFVFECNNLTMGECLKKDLFGTRQGWSRDVVEGDICFLYNIDTTDLLGLWKAVSTGGVTHDPFAWNGDFRQQCRVAKLFSRVTTFKRRELRCLAEGRIPNRLPSDIRTNLIKTFESKLRETATV